MFFCFFFLFCACLCLGLVTHTACLFSSAGFNPLAQSVRSAGALVEQQSRDASASAAPKAKQEQLAFIVKSLRLNKIRALNFVGMQMGREEMQALCEGLKVSTTVMSIDFSGVQLSNAETAMLAEALKSSNVASVNFSKCGIQDKGFEQLSAEWLSSPTCAVSNLQLPFNKFGEQGAKVRHSCTHIHTHAHTHAFLHART